MLKGRWVRISREQFAPSIDWEKTSMIEGVILQRKIVETGIGERNCIIVETNGEKVTIWESAGLSSLFQLPPGTRVRITNEGLKLNPATKRRFRSFIVEYYEEKEEEPF